MAEHPRLSTHACELRERSPSSVWLKASIRAQRSCPGELGRPGQSRSKPDAVQVFLCAQAVVPLVCATDQGERQNDHATGCGAYLFNELLCSSSDLVLSVSSDVPGSERTCTAVNSRESQSCAACLSVMSRQQTSCTTMVADGRRLVLIMSGVCQPRPLLLPGRFPCHALSYTQFSSDYVCS